MSDSEKKKLDLTATGTTKPEGANLHPIAGKAHSEHVGSGAVEHPPLAQNHIAPMLPAAAPAMAEAGLHDTTLANAQALDTDLLFESLEPKHHTKRIDDADSIINQGKKMPPEKHHFYDSAVDSWDNLTDWVRSYSPASIVNNGTKITFGLRGAADAMSVYSGLQYSSKPRAVASLISLSGLALGLVYEEDPISPEERESYKHMDTMHYIGKRLGNALDPAHHVTSTVGLLTIPNGVLMAISGYKQHRPGKTPWELYQGLMTIAAGSAMNFIPDQERAMQVAHAIFTIRSPFAFMQAKKAWYDGIPASATKPAIPKGDIGQAGKFVLNQASNIPALFYAGVEKMPDGSILTIEEADAIRDAEKLRLEQIKASEAELTGTKTLDAPANDFRGAGGTVTVGAPSAKVLATQLSSERVADAPELSKATS